MGVLQRFERRLEGLVEGAFARVFGGVVQPVEVAAALQREAEDKKAIVGQGRVLVPNDFVVELGEQDSARLGEYDAALRRELAAMVDEHAREQGWSFVGPVAVRFAQAEDLGTGTFRVRSAVTHGDDAAPAQRRPPQEGRPRLVVTAGAAAGAGSGRERTVPLEQPVLTVGRGGDADLQLPDTGVSRLHLELRMDGDEVLLVDLQSTNGTSVNGRRVQTATLRDGDRIALGTTSIVFRTGAG